MAPLMRFAEREGADLVLATDPDADRLAVALPDDEGRMQLLTGNQTGALLFDFYYQERKRRGDLPTRPVLVKTIVSDDFARHIATALDVETVESLTGFKHICGKIREIEGEGAASGTYLMGYEESIGFALGKEVLDKDGLSAACWMAAACREQRARGSTLWRRLEALQRTHGYFLANPRQIELEGAEGLAQQRQLMKRLRERTSWAPFVADLPLTAVEDYLTSRRHELAPPTGEGAPEIARTTPIDEARSDVLRFFYGPDLFFAIRPSGTEPKIKIYEYVRHRERREAELLQLALADRVSALLEGPGAHGIEEDA